MVHVLSAVDDLEDQLLAGEAEIVQVFPRERYETTNDVARRCQQCGEPVPPEKPHSWANIRLERPDGGHTGRYPKFCDSSCLDEWARKLDSE